MALNLGAPRLAKFHKMRTAIAADDWQATEIARLVLAVRGKLCRFGQGVKKSRVGTVLGGNAPECAVGGLRITHRFGDAAVNRIITL